MFKIRRFDKKIPLPKYQTIGAAGFDLAARKTVTIKAGGLGIIPLNTVMEVPRGHFVLLCARSSTYKLGLTMINGIGIIDSDFCGNEDEFEFVVQNFTKKTVTIKKGVRIAQGIFVKFIKAKWQEVVKMDSKTRGGFGSTGNK